VPFAGIATFIGLSLFTRSSSGLPRFVRFNIQQASVRPIARRLRIVEFHVSRTEPATLCRLSPALQALVLDILLIVPSLFASISDKLPSTITIVGSNFVFYVMVRMRLCPLLLPPSARPFRVQAPRTATAGARGVVRPRLQCAGEAARPSPGHLGGCYPADWVRVSLCCSGNAPMRALGGYRKN
jgi:hypothetical protein